MEEMLGHCTNDFEVMIFLFWYVSLEDQES